MVKFNDVRGDIQIEYGNKSSMNVDIYYRINRSDELSKVEGMYDVTLINDIIERIIIEMYSEISELYQIAVALISKEMEAFEQIKTEAKTEAYEKANDFKEILKIIDKYGSKYGYERYPGGKKMNVPLSVDEDCKKGGDLKCDFCGDRFYEENCAKCKYKCKRVKEAREALKTLKKLYKDL